MLNRNNRLTPTHTTSAADTLAETMAYYHISQTDLAERLGVSQKHVSDLLKRKKYLSESLALRVEDVMGISASLLLNLDLNYKLQQATVNDKIGRTEHPHGNKFLQRYDWVSAN